MRRLLLACLLLAGCSGTPAVVPKPSAAPTSNPAQAKAKLSLQGALKGFSGDSARFTAADAGKIAIALQDEAGKAVKTGQPDGHGSFVMQEVPSGPYVAVATLPDKTTWSALVRTDRPNDNFLSPGTTLAVAWARNQLKTRLIFLEDLPFPELLAAAILLDAKGQPLPDGDDARLDQAKALIAADASLADRFNQIETLLTKRAAQNLETQPAYASDAEYAAKKAALHL
jgi:hypothetical protein